ncbi:hypothetical protein HD554DRAFT_2112679 [Boletus coccyginus]|nr:hypothetical protein HD554DRAFT_2112679 [Boletus coccyginus]
MANRVPGWETDAPPSPDAWKRAVHKRAPPNFHVKLLPPAKHGSTYSYGFRIYRIRDDDASTTTCATSSGESIVSLDEYDIWRKWEDCLYFQESLEAEYSLAAREKRNRLAAGKGVKKNGVYIHSDQAASWESLPFGPNPNDVARDIHEHIPKLTKKGTLFRPSQETIDHRYRDLRMMMEALLQDDLPTLIKDIKATRTFSDFFGVWRRDIDLARKAESPKKPAADRYRSSISSSILSAFPVSPSSVSVKLSSPTKGNAPEKARVPFGIFIHPDSSSSDDSVGPPRQGRLVDRMQEIRPMRSRGSSSDSSSSLPPTPVTAPGQHLPPSRQPVIASQEKLIRSGHNPHVLGDDRRSSFLESLPEDRELSSSKPYLGEVRSPTRSGSVASKTNRNARVYFTSPTSSLQSSEPPSRSLSRYSRSSLRSTQSSGTLRGTAYLEELDVDYCLPSPTPQPWCRQRASVSSLASLVTNSSVDAVIPRSERPSRSLANKVQQPHSLPEKPYETWSEESQSEDQDDILDTYFYDLIGPYDSFQDGFPETPTTDESMYRFAQAQSSTTVSSYFRYSDRRSSLATSISSGSMSSSGNLMTLSIKAAHEDNIVMLCLPRYIAFDELRRKIYDKFIQTDESTISESFAIALLEQHPAEKMENGRPRAGSVSSLGSAHAKGGTLHFISSQDEWSDVVVTHAGKMFLRIIGSTA